MILGWVGIYLCYFGKKIYTCMQAPQLLSAVRGAGLQDAAALHYLARMDEAVLAA